MPGAVRRLDDGALVMCIDLHVVTARPASNAQEIPMADAVSSPVSTGYVHGTTPDEQRRLSLLNDLVNRQSLEAMAVRPGERLLDVGAGLGQLTRAVARASGARAVGVERSADQIGAAIRGANEAGEQALVDFRQGDADALPLTEREWGAFDIVHARFLLEHLSDPSAVVRQMVRAARRGGRVVLQDDDHDVFGIYPEAPAMWRVWRAYVGVYARLGNDAIVGRKLVALLHRAGARPVRNRWLWCGACAGEETFRPLVENVAVILRGARESLLEFDLIAGGEFDAGLAELDAWARRPDAALWYGFAWAEGVKDSV